MRTEGIFLLKWFEQFWFYYCSWVQFKVKIGSIVSCSPGLISGWARENRSLFIFPLGMTPFVVNKVIFLFSAQAHTFHQLTPKPCNPPFLPSFSLTFLCISHHRLSCSHCISAQIFQRAGPLLRGIPQDILGWKGPTGISEPNSSVHHSQLTSMTLVGSAPCSYLLSCWIFSVQPENSPDILPMPDINYPLGPKHNLLCPFLFYKGFLMLKKFFFLTSP